MVSGGAGGWTNGVETEVVLDGQGNRSAHQLRRRDISGEVASLGKTPYRTRAWAPGSHRNPDRPKHNEPSVSFSDRVSASTTKFPPEMVTPVAGRSSSTEIDVSSTGITQRTSKMGRSVGTSHPDKAARTINRTTLSREARKRS